MNHLRRRPPAAGGGSPPSRRQPRRLLALLALGALILSVGVTVAQAAGGPPQVQADWATEVTATSTTLRAQISPNELPTTYRFEYITEAAFQANLGAGHDGFTGAARIPSGAEAGVGSGSSDVPVSQKVATLTSATTYHYRVTAVNSAAPGGVPGTPHTLTTQEITGAFTLPDNRGWEMVSPVDKNGGAIQGPGQNFGGDVLQAAAQGGAVTYSSASSFGAGAQGAPPASQYIARHGAGGWSTENLTAPLFSASYGDHPDGVPYQLFSTDLSVGLMLNGQRCRGEGGECPVLNPPLPGSGAPAGYQDYYLRDDATGSFQALFTQTDLGQLALGPEQFELAFAGSSPDLRHLVLSTCAALTEGATEVAGTEGCDPTKPNLYEYAEGQLKLINSAPSAKLAAQGGAVSADGSRVYFTEEGKLYLREAGEPPKLISEGGVFQTATPDGSFAFFTKEENLFRYEAATEQATDLTPGGGVEGVLGASQDGSYVYYFTNGGILLPPFSAGLFLWHAGTKTEVAPAAEESDYPPTTGTARISADGNRLLFLSEASLTGYDNTDANTGLPDSEVYLYDGGALTCVSCNPTGEHPLGPSTIPGAIANGKGATDVYKPRVLSANADRLFFDSADALVAQDTNNRSDVYQWEAQGVGNCQRPGGCLNLISSGRGGEGATFVDASETGSDAFFLTGESLVPSDPGSADLYDAREGGGFPAPPTPIECEGDACQPLPGAPEDPTVGTSIPGLPNPPLHSAKPGCPKGKRPVVRKGKTRCVPKQHKRHRKRQAAARNRGGRR